MIAMARARLSGRVWAATLVCLTLIALQTIYLYPLARRIPTFELSLFVWRLAFPTAFLAFGALLAGWREVSAPPRQALVAVATLSTIGLMLVLTGIAPLRLADASKGMSDRRALFDYDRGNGIWGVREYFPNYGSLPRACESVDDAAKALYPDLRAGLKAERPFLVVRHAPVGLVDYRVNGATLQPTACEADLVLGPLPPDGIVTVTERKVDVLLWARLLGFLAALLLIWRAVPLFGRLHPAT